MTYELWHHIRVSKCYRNDFMSHLAYQYLAVTLTIWFAGLIWDVHVALTVGFVGGLIYGFAREEYDRRTGTGWDYHDLLAAMAGLFVAELVMAGVMAP